MNNSTSRHLHVLYAIHGYKPAYRIGGPILSVSAVAERLVRRGHKVTVFTSNSNLDQDLDVPLNRPVDVDGVEVWYFRRREIIPRSSRALSYFSKSVGYLFAPAMIGALRRVVPQVDLVHTHLPFAFPSLAAASAAICFNKPLFYHQRGVFDPERLRFRSLKKRLYIRAVELPIMNRATTLIALTEAEQQSYRALGTSTPCEVIPNGIAVDDYRTSPTSADAQLGVPAGALVILFLGRLHPIKGADRLVSAFLRIARAHPRAVLVMAGPDEWSVEAKLRDAASDAGIRERVIFTGMVTGSRKLDLLARADLFCLPSDGEGFSMAVLEAMASNTAVMLSPGCHFDEVEPRGAGVVVGTSVDELAAALTAHLGDCEGLREMGRRGRALVRERYRWDVVVQRLLDAYGAGIERAAMRR